MRSAQEQHDENAAKDAKDELDALILFKNDLGAFLRMYTFLSQMFDYGNTAIEKRFIFYRRLLPLLEFGRERDGIDLSKVQLTHHSLKGQGKQPLRLGEGEAPEACAADGDGHRRRSRTRRRRASPRSSSG